MADPATKTILVVYDNSGEDTFFYLYRKPAGEQCSEFAQYQGAYVNGHYQHLTEEQQDLLVAWSDYRAIKNSEKQRLDGLVACWKLSAHTGNDHVTSHMIDPDLHIDFIVACGFAP